MPEPQPPESRPPPPRRVLILVVDDQDANRYALARQLTRVGFEVLEARDGHDGLRLAREAQPDLVILDVNLPGMDGFEVLRRLKADPATSSLPVLQISASFVHGQDRAFGLDSGADGYLVQPVEPAELVATVRALLRANAAEAELRRLNADLERRVDERTAELAERSAEQESFLYTVSHDLRAPLLAIHGMSVLLDDALASGDVEETSFALGRIQANVGKMGQLLDDLLALSRVGRAPDPPQPLDLGTAVGAALEDLEPRLRERGVRVDLQAAWPRVLYPPSEVAQLLSNLLGNAAKFAGRDGEPPQVVVAASADRGTVTLRVSDNGPGVPPQQRERVFALFQKLDARAEGTGVGLAIVRRIAERHGGRAWVEDSDLGGASFAVTLPAAS